MKRTLTLLLAFAFIAWLVACANENASESTDGITGAIHRVEYGDNVAYLFGTMHVGHPEWFPLADVVEDALRRSDVVALEIEEIAMDAEALQKAIEGVILIPDGLTWSQYLPEDTYNHLVEVLSTWNVSYGLVNTVNPLMLINELEFGLILSMSDIDVNPEHSVDVYIANAAQELGLPIIGLESAEQQLNIAFNPPFEVVVARIMSFLPQEESIEALNEQMTLDELAYYYEANDFESSNSIWTLGLSIDEECLYVIYMREVIGNWRSTYYANEIIRLLQETEESTTFFVAVGLSHIIRSGAGDEFTDIVQQLELVGFTVTPLW